MNHQMKEILLRRSNKVFLPECRCDVLNSDIGSSAPYVVAASKNMESLGFCLSPDVMNHLLNCSIDEIKSFYDEYITMLKELIGADKSYTPMYPDFPNQVAEMDDVELFINAIVHYATAGQLLPEYEKHDRFPLIVSESTGELNILTLAHKSDLISVANNLLSSKTSISDTDRDDVEQILLYLDDCEQVLPNYIALRENVAWLGCFAINNPDKLSMDSVKRYFHTDTDVLRLITAMSNGDISLAKRTKYIHLSRPQRRMIMDLLVHVESGGYDDLYRYRDEWIRIAEIIHVGEYRRLKKYANVVKSFDSLRSGEKPYTEISDLEMGFESGDEQKILRAATSLSKSNAGEFARRLDKILRSLSLDNQKKVLNLFSYASYSVSTPVLLQVMKHFSERMKDTVPEYRVFMPKGSVARTICVPNELPEIDKDVCTKVFTSCLHAIECQYKKRDPLGNVYIDKELDDFILPFSQRSASKSNRMIVRGSKLPIDEHTKWVRGFIWWTNMKNQRVDIDLSASILDEHFNRIAHVSFTNLRQYCNDVNGAVGLHSGDIVDGGAPNGTGAAEFIDINLENVIAMGGRYVAFNVLSFTRQKFFNIDNVSFGWMNREDPDSGEVFEPSTVEMRIDVRSDSITTMPVVFDCKERYAVWVDMPIRVCYHVANAVENLEDRNSAALYAMLHMRKPNMLMCATINAMARGKIVSSPEEADIVFTSKLYGMNPPKDGARVITPSDLDFWMSEMI